MLTDPNNQDNQPEKELAPEASGASVLVADDDPGIRIVLRHRLEAAGYRVEEAADSQSSLEAILSNRHDVALLDIMMPGVGGLEVLTAAREQAARTMIIVITAASTMNNAVEAMKRGAHDYLTKPFENLDLVAVAVARAVEVAVQSSDLNRLQDDVNRQLVGGEIIGRSPAMQEVYKLIGRMVNNDATVLLRGESGTGKELVARAIHFKSPRWRGPFVAVNCSAIPHGLLESELFGHERGAFTGATERRAGKVEQASGGTLFLDEIGDLPVELQPKLLRVLQEREFSRVGGFETLRMQARVIAATNQDLESAVVEKKFREDLYFRLRVIPIDLPPLRERREDIAELTDYFIGKAIREMGANARYISPEARAKLQNYSWPGNVRELENAVLRAALLAPTNTVRADDVELGRGGMRVSNSNLDAGASLTDLIARRITEMIEMNGSEPRDLYQKLVGELEKPLIEIALERAGGNQVHAARILGLNRNTLRKKLTEHRIVPQKALPQ
ncbi:MAG: sigma-54-dependent Fis family transcriptional regulator [Deltaproteobacteria bacterium]|nr:sigma-54-dependent Fis family transcriptional regulator [Deltaproteobacteria bacterium]